MHTFVVCAYGESPYIEECIESLKNQTVRSKIILASPYSSEFVNRLSEKYGLELFIRNGEANIKEDWNYGFNRAKTKYVTIAHQDDYYCSEYTEKLISKMEKAQKPVIGITDYLPLKGGSTEKDLNCKLRRFLRSPLKLGGLNKKRFVKRAILAFGNSICCPTVTYNKELLGEDVFTSPLQYSIDWDTFYLLADVQGSYEYVDEPLAYYRIHDGATSKEFITNHKRIKDDIYMFNKFWPQFIVKLLMCVYKKAYKNYDN